MIDQGGEVFIEEVSQEDLVKKALNASKFLQTFLPLIDTELSQLKAVNPSLVEERTSGIFRELLAVKLIGVEQKEEDFRNLLRCSDSLNKGLLNLNSYS